MWHKAQEQPLSSCALKLPVALAFGQVPQRTTQILRAQWGQHSALALGVSLSWGVKLHGPTPMTLQGMVDEIDPLHPSNLTLLWDQ